MPTIIWERAFEIESQGSKKLKGHLSYESTFMHISYHIERRPIELGKAEYKRFGFQFQNIIIYSICRFRAVQCVDLGLPMAFPIQFGGELIVLESLIYI